MQFLKILQKVLAFLSGKRAVSQRVITMVTRDWQEAEVLLKGSSPSQLKQALIIADKSLDSVLKDLVMGETMGERLKNAKTIFRPEIYDKIWQAHKLRNSLVHESGFEVQGFVLKASVKHFKDGLKELGVKL
jgi:hypothetical protein